MRFGRLTPRVRSAEGWKIVGTLNLRRSVFVRETRQGICALYFDPPYIDRWIPAMTRQKVFLVAACAVALLLLLSEGGQCYAKSESISPDLKEASLLVRRRHPDRALPLLNAIILREPKNLPALLAKAKACTALGKYDEAMAVLGTVLRMEPRNIAAIVARSNLNYLTGCYTQATVDANLAIQINPRDGHAHVALARVLLRALKSKEAQGECAKALEVEPKKSDLWRETAVIQKSLRKGHLTTGALLNAIKLAPGDTTNYDELASFYIEKKMYDKAIEPTQKALQIDPEDGFALLNRARLFLAKRKLQEALSVAEAAERNIAYSGYPNSLKGEIYQRMMEDETAVAEYSKAISKQPHCAEFYIGRGLAEIGRRNFQSSLKDFTRANELGHGDTSALSLRADLYETLNKWDESLKDLNSCIKANPKDSTLFIRRGIVLRHLNQLSDAHRDFDKAIAIYPSNGTYEMRGEFHLHAKDYKSAIADFSTALRFLPQSKKALRGLSSAYEGLGRKDLAAEARNKATGDMERVIDQYSRAADGFSRLKHSLGK